MLNVLGRYRIVRPLGQGGMGEVYLADDERLHRQVALKVLPPHLVSDPDRRRRFEREARAIAALNHPNIVTIYSVEEDGGVPFLTMEFVTGSALTDLIPRGGLDLARLLHITVPLTDAIAAAHAKRIVHRDLKPANVMVDDEGRVRVLDFGLAKLAEPALSTLTEPSLLDDVTDGPRGGTAAYMSPEQAEGKPADHRSDIFALGVLLYEMACGERPFKGDGATAVLSAIVSATPRPLSDVKPNLPGELTRIVRRCLVKDPEQRYQMAKDLRNDLQDVRGGFSSAERQTASARRFSSRRLALPLTALAIVASVWMTFDIVPRIRGTGSEGERSDPAPSFGPATEVSNPGTQNLVTANLLSLSPDGQWVAYAAGVEQRKQDIFLQSVHGQRAFNLTANSAFTNLTPRFSPDGERIAFRSQRDGGGIFIMGRTGESVTRLTDFGYSPAWSPDGKRLALASDGDTDDPRTPPLGNSELWLVTVLTGERSRLPIPDGLQPAWSPDGAFIAYWGRDGRDPPRQIFAIRPNGTGRVQITDGTGGDFSPTWSPDGKHLYFLSDRGGRMNLWRVGFDRTAGRATGRPQPVTLPAGNVPNVSFSAAHRVAWVSNDLTTYVQSMAIDARSGKPPPGEPSTLLRSQTQFWDLDLSPDGSSIVLSALDGGQLFICTTDGSSLRQLTMRPGRFRDPQWSPDGRRITFSSEDLGGGWGFWSIAPDGSNLRKMQFPVTRGFAVWSPDGLRLAATDLSEPTARSTRVFGFDAGVAAISETLPATPDMHRFVATAWSPDATRLAGHLTGGGVAIYSFANRNYEQLTDRGVFPTWFRDGQRLLFTIWSPPTLVVLDLKTRRTSPLFTGDAALDVITGVRLTRDNRRAYIVRSRIQTTIWTAELK